MSDFKIIPSQRGKPIIVADNFKYSRNKYVKQMSAFKWRCYLKTCPAKLYVSEDMTKLVQKVGDHNHGNVSDRQIVKELVSNSVKLKALNGNTVKDIVLSEIIGCEGAAKVLTAKDADNIKLTVYRARMKYGTSLPKSLDETVESIGAAQDSEIIKAAEVSAGHELSTLEEPLIDYPSYVNVGVKEEPQDGMEQAFEHGQTTSGTQTSDGLQMASDALPPPDLSSMDDFKPVVLITSTMTEDPLAQVPLRTTVIKTEPTDGHPSVPLRTTVIKAEPSDDHTSLSPSGSKENDEDEVSVVESCDNDTDEFVEQPASGSNDDFINRLHFPASETYSVGGKPGEVATLKHYQWSCTWCKKLSVMKKTMYRCAACPEKPGLCIECFIPWHVKVKNFRTN